MASDCIWGNYRLILDNERYSLSGDWRIQRGGTVLSYETNLDGSLQYSGETMPWKFTGGQISACEDLPTGLCGISMVLEFFNQNLDVNGDDQTNRLRGYSFPDVSVVGQGELDPKGGYWTGFELVARTAREIRR